MLTTPNLATYSGLIALHERTGNCATLTKLDLAYCYFLTTLPGRLGDCVALATLDLRWCGVLPRHPDIAEILTARGCEVRR